MTTQWLLDVAKQSGHVTQSLLWFCPLNLGSWEAIWLDHDAKFKMIDCCGDIWESVVSQLRTQTRCQFLHPCPSFRYAVIWWKTGVQQRQNQLQGQIHSYIQAYIKYRVLHKLYLNFMVHISVTSMTYALWNWFDQQRQNQLQGQIHGYIQACIKYRVLHKLYLNFMAHISVISMTYALWNWFDHAVSLIKRNMDQNSRASIINESAIWVHHSNSFENHLIVPIHNFLMIHSNMNMLFMD